MPIQETVADVLTEYIDFNGHYPTDEIGDHVPTFIQLGRNFFRLKYTSDDPSLLTRTTLNARKKRI